MISNLLINVPSVGWPLAIRIANYKQQTSMRKAAYLLVCRPCDADQHTVRTTQIGAAHARMSRRTELSRQNICSGADEQRTTTVRESSGKVYNNPVCIHDIICLHNMPEKWLELQINHNIGPAQTFSGHGTENNGQNKCIAIRQ